ncbi:MAG: hypothetical protein JO206_01180 [Solirubrobacterales bacterium]|nr:hypothetical protein [Solirubrobacterales bacterium]MBV9837862.1 hypothetical protein [Solirubrobacterales bacterium]
MSKTTTLILVAVAGVVAFVLWQRRQPTAPRPTSYSYLPPLGAPTNADRATSQLQQGATVVGSILKDANAAVDLYHSIFGNSANSSNS